MGIFLPEHASANFLTQADDFDPCHKYVSNHSTSDPSTPFGYCSADNFGSNATTTCSAWVYDTSQMESTLTTEENLVCDEDYKRRLLGTVLMIGEDLSSP